MEPLQISFAAMRRAGLPDVATELNSKASGLRRSLPVEISASLANLVRSVNCYYSNWIEGHKMHPIDIERALAGNYSSDSRERSLQLEAKAHISAQRWIDEGGLIGRAVTVEGILETHLRFAQQLPPDLLSLASSETGQRIRLVPGSLRLHDVQVGRHVAVSPGAVPRFIKRFSSVYGRLGRTDAILASAAAHHRLLWIHPFLDGNGRVARLMSHAWFLDTLSCGGVWSISRGLARHKSEYMQHLMACDQSRRNDLAGRGPLSEEALVAFTRFFLRVCIDQIDFMDRLVDPRNLLRRISLWAQDEIRSGLLPARSDAVLEMTFYRRELPRSEVARTLGISGRQARRITSGLLARGALVSESARAPLRIAFPAELAMHWMPGLFPSRSG